MRASDTFQPMMLCCLQLQMSHIDIAAHMKHLNIPKPEVRVGQERTSSSLAPSGTVAVTAQRKCPAEKRE